MADPFETLGIAASFDVDLGALEQRHRDLSRVLHPDRHVGGSPAERRMSLGKAIEVNDAFRVVRDPIRRAEALLALHGILVKEGAEPKASPAFLMETLEKREELADARARRDRGAIERLAKEVAARQDSAIEKLSVGFRAEAGDSMRKLVPLVGDLRYYQRFLEEVSAIEDEQSSQEQAS